MRNLKLFTVLVAGLLAACNGGKNPAGPTNPTPTATQPPAVPVVLGFKVWSNALCPESIPCTGGEIAPKDPKVPNEFDLHGYAGGYFEGYADFPVGCEVTGKYTSIPAQSLLNAGEEPVKGLSETVAAGKERRFVKGLFRYRGPDDPRYSVNAIIEATMMCGSTPIVVQLTIHQVK